MLKSLLPWVGGKYYMIKDLLPLIPPHKIYVEPCGGMASLLLAKDPSPVEVYNDIDSGLVNFFRCLRDPNKAQRLHELLSMTPYSREEFYEMRSSLNDGDDIERAYKWFCVARMCFGGNFRKTPSWGYALASSRRNMSSTVSKFLSSIDRLLDISKRLLLVQIEHDDILTIIDRYDSDETFFYIDPPYMQQTRSKHRYRHEMTDQDHEKLLGKLLKCSGRFLISGHMNDLYRSILEHCNILQLEKRGSVVAKTKETGLLGKGALRDYQRREVVWYNYNMIDSTLLQFGSVDNVS